jgi:DNA-binding NarL/FixJ family response regulator
VILTDEDDETVVGAVRAGAVGYLKKDADVPHLLEAIRSAAQGHPYLSASAATRLMREIRTSEPALLLSQRERDVLRLLGLGASNKEIAQALLIAESTVKTHVRALLSKLGAQSRTQAALQALRLRLVSPGELRAA